MKIDRNSKKKHFPILTGNPINGEFKKVFINSIFQHNYEVEFRKITIISDSALNVFLTAPSI